ncbi:DtxR family transcriptional regulator [Kouleothrix aurantiaca]|jgi:DtxR family Mn-dependent transcriptional regulator|uniref:Manganese transport regulator n=1 Tax=Kouleothrix aurantiaca TaxID=186479 RepID=A0A0N8PS12_9CHLR|nr:DtxR family transcriptional regulator [Kouleothrix aurantiaca]
MPLVGASGGLSERISPAIEDYLKAIYTLGRTNPQVSTSLLADHLGFKPASVTGMLKTMADLQLVSYTPYRGVELTPTGERLALEVVRHHRLIELFLVQTLGFSWDEVHEEAERLEHHISEKLEARIAAHLGEPIADPHGDPIPTREGTMPTNQAASLADMGIGEHGCITRVRDQHPDRLRYLADLGMVPGAQIEVLASAPFDGPLTVRIGGASHAIDRRLAREIYIARAGTYGEAQIS